jgi:hypothetical protein
MNVAALEAALSTWAEQVLPARPTHWVEQNAAPPTGEYTSLQFLEVDQFGRTEVAHVNQAVEDGEDVWEDVSVHGDITLQIDLYRGDASGDMALLKASPSRYDDDVPLAAGGLGFLSATQTLDLSAVVHEGVGWEDRRQSDFRFSTVYTFRRELITIARQTITNADTGHDIEIDPPA